MIINIMGRQLEGSVATRRADPSWGGRESKAITVTMTYAEAVALFEHDTPWSVTVELQRDDGSMEAITTDMSEYAISGPITDNRDGTVTVRMGKYGEDELLAITLYGVPESHQEAVKLRSIIEEAVQSIEDDSKALAAVKLYPAWGALLPGTKLDAGMRIQHDGELYRVLQPHTVSAEWEPGVGTESLYARIDEVHSGTADDPIPYEGNMALTSGLHYTQGGVVYLCVRDSINPVHHALADLVGLYVEVVA